MIATLATDRALLACVLVAIVSAMVRSMLEMHWREKNDIGLYATSRGFRLYDHAPLTRRAFKVVSYVMLAAIATGLLSLVLVVIRYARGGA